MTAHPLKFTNRELAEALRHGFGIPEAATRWLNRQHGPARTMTSTGFRKRIKGNENLQRIRDEAREDYFGLLEGLQFRAGAKGDLKTGRFILSRLARHRGWGATVDIRAPDGLVLRKGPPLKQSDLDGKTAEDLMREINEQIANGS